MSLARSHWDTVCSFPSALSKEMPFVRQLLLRRNMNPICIQILTHFYCICDLGEEINHKRRSLIKEGVRWPYVGIIRSNLRILGAKFNEIYYVRNPLEFKRWRHVLTLISSRTSSFINLNYRLSTIRGFFSLTLIDSTPWQVHTGWIYFTRLCRIF